MKDDSERIAQYLLGELSEEELSLFEERFFHEPELSQEIRAARDELIDSYLQGELSEVERRRFESYFLASPERRRRVELARSFMQKISVLPIPATGARTHIEPSSWLDRLRASLPENRLAVALSFASLVILFLGAWLSYEILRTPNQGGVVEPERAEVKRPEEPQQPQTNQNANIAQSGNTNSNQNGKGTPGGPKSPTSPIEPDARIASLVLNSSLVRDPEETNRLTIPKETDLVRLQAILQSADYKRYQAELTTVEGEPVWSQNAIKPEPTRYGKAVVINVPAERFANQDYILRVSAKAASGEAVTFKYYFRVAKQ
jgi:hypothetical protein